MAYCNAKRIIGLAVGAVDGTIGHVRDLYFNDTSWEVRYVMVDTGGLVGGLQVLIPPGRASVDLGRRRLDIDLTRQEVKQSLPRNLDPPLAQRREISLARDMGWMAPWEYRPMEEPISRAAAQEATARVRRQADAEGGPCHRSVNEVTGYELRALDGQAGNVIDFMVDPVRWCIRYLVVDTGNWLPGRRVLVPPARVETVSWAWRQICVKLTRRQVRLSTPYRFARPAA
jgi:hypothetical protein